MKKLGQLLLERGWIDRGDLDRALAAQSTFGGRLGTCLLEVGALREEQLLDALSIQRRYEPAGADLLRSVPGEAHTLIPARLAHAHGAVPLGVHRDRLAIAAVDPDDLVAQDEFAFAASRKVSPSIALEVRVAEALERYYDIPTSKRFGRILDKLNRARYLWRESRGASDTAAAEGSELFPEAPTLRFPVLPELDIGPGSEPWTTTERHPQASGRTAPSEPPSPAPSPPAPSPSPSRSPPPPTPLRPPDEASSPTPGEAAGRYDELLSTANSRDDVGRRLLAQLRTHFDRVALFATLSDGIRGWLGSGPGFSPTRLSEFRVSYTEPSVFLNLRRGIGFHLGPLPSMPAHRDLARCWQDEPSETCFLLPITVRGHLVTVAYGDRLGRSLADLDLEAIRDLGRAAGTALERCIVLKKQTQTGARAV